MGLFDFLFGKRIVAQNDKEWAFLKGAKSGDIIGIKEGLRKNVDINIRDRVGNSALWLAASSHHYAICELLIQNGADPNNPDSEGTTPFDMAYMVRVNNPEILELFEKHFGKQKK